MDWSQCTRGSDQVATLQCLPVIFGFAINWLLIFAGVIALIIVILSGIKYITAGGDQKKLDTAKRTLTYALLGLILIFISFLIITLIGYITGATCINNFGFNCSK
jgi:hypothetical protein